MSKQKKYAGETSVSLAVFIQDTSSTTGGGLAGVTSASSGLVFEYRRQGQSSWTSVTPVAGKVLGTYLSGGIVADGALSGAYEVDFPDAAFAAGAKAVFLRIRGVTNMFPCLIEVELDAVNYQLDAFGALKPTTAGRTLDVSVGGEAGIDFGNIGSPDSTVALSGTTIKAVVDRVTANTDRLANQIITAAAGVTFPASVADDTTVAKDSTVAKDATVAKESTLDTKASQISVDAIPINPLLDDDIRLNSISDIYNSLPLNLDQLIIIDGKVALQPGQSIDSVDTVIQPVTTNVSDEAISALALAITNAIYPLLRSLDIVVKPEVKVLGPCPTPVTQMPRRLN